jgi:hypothetical protein
MENMKNLTWNDTVVKVKGVFKMNEDDNIAFTPNKFGKFTATLKVKGETDWDIVGRRSTFVFIDGLREQDVEAFNRMKSRGDITNATELVVIGHLVRTPGKPGMNDILNMKTLSVRPAMKDEDGFVNFDEALTKDEWQIIRKQRFNETSGEAPVAPTAPTAPSVPF